jgi:hypothetical protein
MHNSSTSAASIVPIKTDYGEDDAICLITVSFIPVNVADVIVRKIIRPLSLLEPDHYYYPAQSMHVTIKNIRKIHHPPNFSIEDVNRVGQVFANLIPQLHPFSFELGKIIPFPTSVSVIGYSDSYFSEIVLKLNRALDEIGLQDDKRYLSNEVFFGNITFCRFTKQPSLNFLRTIDHLSKDFSLKMPVKTMSLVAGNAVMHPNSLRVYGAFSLAEENYQQNSFE